MKKCVWASLPVLLAVTLLGADDRTRLYSDPLPPPREALDRLNLKQEWSAFVPMDGRKDGFVSIHFDGGQMLVQTRSGMVAVLNAETGRMVWHTSFGKAYQTAFPLAFNSFGVYAVNGGTIYALDRASGAVKWKFRQPEGLSAAPVCDEVQMYLSTSSGRAYAYFLPLPPKAGSGPPPETTPPPPPLPAAPSSTESPYASPPTAEKDSEAGVREPQPIYAWESNTYARLEYKPLMSYESLMFVTPTGTVLGLAKYPLNSVVPEVYRIKLERGIAVPPGVFEDVLKNGQIQETAYLGGEDSNVYAFGITTGKEHWRFTVGTPVVYKPVATAEDVYVTAERSGMFRLSRASGEPQWRIKRGNRTVEGNPDADRFLAANPKFVYATDKSNRLLILDRALGTEISSYDTRDFAFPVANEMNDRLYLAANNGLIVCLHDKEYMKPFFHQKQNAGSSALTVDDRIKLAKDNLARKISDPGVPDPMPLREAIEKVRKTYRVQIFSSDGVFTKQNLDPVNGKLVTIPKVDNVTLGDFLKQIFGQVGATYELTADVVVVIPLKDKKPPDKGPPPPPPGPMVPPPA